MQQLEYVNLRGRSVVFGGSPPYVLEHVDGLGLAPLELIRAKGVYQHGDTVKRIGREPRTVEARFHVDGRPSRKDLYRYRVELLSILSPQFALNEETGETARLYYENDHGRWWTGAVPQGVEYVQRLEDFMVSCPLDFHCPSVYWRGMGENSVVLEMATGAFQLPFTLPFTLGNRRFTGTVQNESHLDTPVKITIYGTGEMPSLVNHSTGHSISLQRTVATGERLEIGTDEDDLYVNLVQASGQVVPAYGYLSLDSALSEFTLRPGENFIEYMPSVPSEGSRVSLSWFSRYEGV